MPDLELYIRYALEYAMLVPGTIGYLLSVWKFIHIDKRVLIGVIVGFDAVCIGLGALLSWKTGIPTNMVLQPVILIALAVSLFIVDLNRTQIVFAYVNSVMLCAWSVIITLYIFASVEASDPDAPFRVVSGLVSLFMCVLVFLFFGNILARKLPVMFLTPEIGFIWKYAWLFPVTVTSFLIWVIPINVSNILVGRILQVAVVIWFLVIISIYLFYHFLWYFTQKLTREQHLIEEMRVLNAEKIRFSQMEGYVTEMRSLRHDLRQHMRVLSIMAASEQYDEMKQYLDKYVESVKPEYTEFSTNYAVDSIAAYYQDQADKKDIRMIWNIFLVPDLAVDETELCVVIGNLLENAIRASEKVEPSERLIEASIRMVGENMIGIEIRNHYAGKIRLNSEGMPVSNTREGIGLYSVANTVRKNNGTFTLEVDDEWFCVDIIINVFGEGVKVPERGTEDRDVFRISEI